jgi:hypothetical protein
LIEASKEEKKYTELSPLLADLKKKVAQNKEKDLVLFKSEIAEILTEQIAFHYALNAGRVEVSLSQDSALVMARQILNSPEKFDETLSANKK